MHIDSHAVAERIDAVVGDTVGEAAAWTFDESPEPSDGYRLRLPDRTLDIEPRDGPADAVHWVLTLRAGSEIVSKFGPHESVADLLEALREILESDTGYTVCCDGDPDS